MVLTPTHWWSNWWTAVPICGWAQIGMKPSKKILNCAAGLFFLQLLQFPPGSVVHTEINKQQAFIKFVKLLEDATQRKTEVRRLFWCRTGEFCNLRSKQKNCRLTTAEKWAAETVGEAAVTAILAAPQRGHGVGWRWSLWFVAGSLPLGAKHAAC